MDFKIKLLPDKFRPKFESPISIISKLGQHGNRSLVLFFSSFNISYLDYELIERFFLRQVSTLYVLYINNLNKKYTQKQNHFPNLFLVDCCVMDGTGFEDAHLPHMHTYWLKYFILKTIVFRGKIKFSEIMEIFCTIGGYDEHLVRHVVGSLCTANEFRCAEIEYNDISKNIHTYKIKPTERGRSLLRSTPRIEFCFGTQYLETIIDDLWLSLPNPYCNSIYFPKVDYSHLFYANPEYINASIDLVSIKTKAILSFIKVLESAYLVEIKLCKPKLHVILDKDNMIPKFHLIRKNIINAGGRIIKTLSPSKMELGYSKDFEAYNKALEQDESLVDFFRKYYSSGIKVSA